MASLDSDLLRQGQSHPEPVTNPDEERRRQIEEICARARARAKAEGLKPPTPEEIDEILGYNELGFFD